MSLYAFHLGQIISHGNQPPSQGLSTCNLRRRDFPPAGKGPAIGWSRASQNLEDNKKIQLRWVTKYVLSLSKE
jgi:hypothetical protein